MGFIVIPAWWRVFGEQEALVFGQEQHGACDSIRVREQQGAVVRRLKPYTSLNGKSGGSCASARQIWCKTALILREALGQQICSAQSGRGGSIGDGAQGVSSWGGS